MGLFICEHGIRNGCEILCEECSHSCTDHVIGTCWKGATFMSYQAIDADGRPTGAPHVDSTAGICGCNNFRGTSG